MLIGKILIKIEKEQKVKSNLLSIIHNYFFNDFVSLNNTCWRTIGSNFINCNLLGKFAGFLLAIYVNLKYNNIPCTCCTY